MSLDFAAQRENAIGSIPDGWALAIGSAASAAQLAPIADFVAAQSDTLPAPDRVFAALRSTPFESVRAVILGQDPYPTRAHAMGLAFSVPRDLPGSFPPSLVRIRSELRTDGGWSVPEHGSLEAWADKGVLLLNTSLTVRQGHSGSHARAGWTVLTAAIIEAVAAKDNSVAFLLWGQHAQASARLITSSHHVIVCAPHPMARSSAGFKGSRPFSRANEGLKRQGADPIDWSLTE